MDSGRLNATSWSLTSINSSSPFTRREEISRYLSGFVFSCLRGHWSGTYPQTFLHAKSKQATVRDEQVVSDPPHGSSSHHPQSHQVLHTQTPPLHRPWILNSKGWQFCHFTFERLPGTEFYNHQVPFSSELFPVPPAWKNGNPSLLPGKEGCPFSLSIANEVGKAGVKNVGIGLDHLQHFKLTWKQNLLTAVWKSDGSSIRKMALWVGNITIQKWSLPVVQTKYILDLFFFFNSSPRNFHLHYLI